MTWLHWALLAAFFAGMTAVLAKVGVKEIDPDWATAIRTTIVLIFTWSQLAGDKTAFPRTS